MKCGIRIFKGYPSKPIQGDFIDYAWLGFAGLVLLVLGWIPQTWQTLKAKNSSLNIQFALLYFAGSLVLAIYSFLINDIVFVILNSAATIMAFVNLYFSPSLFGSRKQVKKQRKR